MSWVDCAIPKIAKRLSSIVRPATRLTAAGLKSGWHRDWTNTSSIASNQGGLTTNSAKLAILLEITDRVAQWQFRTFYRILQGSNPPDTDSWIWICMHPLYTMPNHEWLPHSKFSHKIAENGASWIGGRVRFFTVRKVLFTLRWGKPELMTVKRCY